MRKYLTLAAVLVVLTPFLTATWPAAVAQQQQQDARIALAVSDVKTLAMAALGYEIQYGARPVDLKTLAVPPAGKPYIEPQTLNDPWGRPYKYNAAGPKNQGLKPDVWSEGPDPKNPASIIGNWPGGAPAIKPPMSIEQKLDTILSNLEAIEKRLAELEKRK